MMNQFTSGGGEGPVGRKRPRFGQQEDTFDYVPKRKAEGQRPVDYFCSAINHVKTRIYRNDVTGHHVPPHEYYCHKLLPVSETTFSPSTALCTQWVHTILHPDARAGSRRKVFYAGLQWSPNGRRLLTTTNQGEFLLYNGHSFTVEMKTVGHKDSMPCKALAWGRSTDLIMSGDDAGTVKVWLSNFTTVSEFDTNQKGVREIAWAPGENKFATAGQDGSARIWDTNRVTSGAKIEVESRLEGHGGDVHTVDWHPSKAVLLTGSQDRDARLWDPRKGEQSHIATLQSHAQPVTCVRWHSNGYWFLTAGRDGYAKLWDMRTMKEMVSYEGHSKDITSLAWHPSHPNLFSTASVDGSIANWIVAPGEGTKRTDGVCQVEKPAALIPAAHEEQKGIPNAINCIRWSPMGHLLVTAAQEVKFWTRNKPGATLESHNTDSSADQILQQ